MPVKQPKKLSSSVRIKYFNGPKIIEELTSIAKDIGKKNNNILGIYLFGSLCEKTYMPGSDADILIILRKDPRRIINRTTKYLKCFLNASVAVDIFPYTKNEFDKMMLEGNVFINHIWGKKIILVEREKE